MAEITGLNLPSTGVGQLTGRNLQNAGNFKITSVNSADEVAGGEFKNVLNNAIAEVDKLYDVTASDTKALLSGEVDNLAQVMANSAKASLGLNMVVQVRNRVVDAYNELMRMQL